MRNIRYIEQLSVIVVVMWKILWTKHYSFYFSNPTNPLTCGLRKCSKLKKKLPFTHLPAKALWFIPVRGIESSSRSFVQFRRLWASVTSSWSTICTSSDSRRIPRMCLWCYVIQISKPKSVCESCFYLLIGFWFFGLGVQCSKWKWSYEWNNLKCKLL